MLTKDLLRVSRAGGTYRPQFASADTADLAARVIGVYQGHVGESRQALEVSLQDVESAATDFKLVRGFAKLLEREASFETRAPVVPEQARRTVFSLAQSVGVVTSDERQSAIDQAATALGVSPVEVDASLFADLEDRQILAGFDSRWTPDELIDRYNLSLGQTALFNATEVRVRSSDPKALVSAVKRLGLMYEILQSDAGRTVVVTGPDALFQSTRRYGTRFAQLLRTLVSAPEWELEAVIDDGGTERTMRLSASDPLRVPDEEPVMDVQFDSGIEADFATRFSGLDLDWTLTREPEPLAAGSRVMIPDFAFDYTHGDFRVFFEIMGFWTPSYVTKKLDQLATVEDVELVVAVDESLGVADEVAERDHRVITYRDHIRMKDVRATLREYETDLVAAARATLPDTVTPGADVVTLEAVASDHGVSVDAIEPLEFPDHDLVGRTLVRPAVLEEVANTLSPGMTFDEADGVLTEHGISETSAALSALGYHVSWDGLSGGRLERSD